MTNSTPQRVNILEEAKNLTTGQREQDYGTPQENFGRMADYANIIFKKNFETGEPITARQTAEFMITVKLARLANSPTFDTYVDIAGYAALAGELSGASPKASSTPAVPDFATGQPNFDPTAHIISNRSPEEIRADMQKVVEGQTSFLSGGVG